MLPPHLTDPLVAAAQLQAMIAGPVAPELRPLRDGLCCSLAADLLLPGALPAEDSAAQDGWAVRADETSGASAYAPAPLSRAAWVEMGAALPAGADAVLPAFGVDGRAPHLVALAEAIAGDGVHPAGAEAPAALLLRRAGEPLRVQDLPLLTMAGLTTVAVRRPRVVLLPIGDDILASLAADRLSPFLSRLAAREGVALRLLPPVADDPGAIAAALREGTAEADLILSLGGTGMGHSDRAAAGLALAGQVVLHGLGARPGSSAGFGIAGGRPVILVPGHPSDALACWLMLARPAVRKLSGALPPPRRLARLARRVTSTVGLAELVLLRRGGAADLVEPLATGTLSLSALAAAEAVMIVPPGSEGYETGRQVEVEDL